MLSTVERKKNSRRNYNEFKSAQFICVFFFFHFKSSVIPISLSISLSLRTSQSHKHRTYILCGGFIYDHIIYIYVHIYTRILFRPFTTHTNVHTHAHGHSRMPVQLNLPNGGTLLSIPHRHSGSQMQSKANSGLSVSYTAYAALWPRQFSSFPFTFEPPTATVVNFASFFPPQINSDIAYYFSIFKSSWRNCVFDNCQFKIVWNVLILILIDCDFD